MSVLARATMLRVVMDCRTHECDVACLFAEVATTVRCNTRLHKTMVDKQVPRSAVMTDQYCDGMVKLLCVSAYLPTNILMYDAVQTCTVVGIIEPNGIFTGKQTN